ncbi:CAP domain-containing protein [Bacillaceae bacterium S4-13-56]
MKWLRITIFLFFVLIVSIYITIKSNDVDTYRTNDVGMKTSIVTAKANPNYIEFKGQIYHWIGKPVEDWEKAFGEPNRIDPTKYSYDWWIYDDLSNSYYQIGVNDKKIVSIFAFGNDSDLSPFQIGASYTEIDQEISFRKYIEMEDGRNYYRFELTDEDLITRPIVQLTDRIFAQFYFDRFSGKLSAIRMMNQEILLEQRPFELYYRGNLSETKLIKQEQWKKINEATAKQIFSITNRVRQQKGLNRLVWDDNIAQVAFSHSKEMGENQFFSHFSKNGNGLKERLQNQDIAYLAAGENIAAQYVDAPDVVEGWLNSESHRETLLEEEYTHMGIGVYQLYYTQNFVKRME